MRKSQGCTKPGGAMKVKVCLVQALVRSREEFTLDGRTTGPSQPPRRRGGARAYLLGPERW